jgi:DNA/RNA endonuclease G (NUC1)
VLTWIASLNSIMNTLRLLALTLLSLTAFGSVHAAAKADTTYIQQVADGEISAAGVPAKKGKMGWWARSWTKTDGNGFQGKPQTMTATDNADTNVIIRYTCFATEYDAEFHSPVWGAYTIDATTLQNDLDGERPASNPDFARPGQFFQEPLIVSRSKMLNVDAASHGTFTSTYEPRFPFLTVGIGVSAAEAKLAKVDRSIQRGHMVPNNAMKCQGTIEQGQTAQIESFSVANIVPQLAKSNAPTWSGLESACFDWAKELGQVWMIVGPVYHNREAATYIKKIKSDADQVTPSPDELFYVVIGKRNGQTAAIGFLLPHQPEILDFRAYAVPVDTIELKTGLNFMPEVPEADNAIEAAFDQAWLHTPARKSTVENDDH